MIFLLLILGLVYLVFVIVIAVCWSLVKEFKPENRALDFYSIIVPVRNEANNIADLLKDLDSQTYPKDKYEVIVINDHSTDDTEEVIQNIQEGLHCSFQYVILDELMIGKKAAITQGINISNGQKIITTDGDCRVGGNWISSINLGYQQSETKMVFGAVSYAPIHSFFQKLQCLDFAALIVTGAAMNYLGKASMCNGANLSFDKSAFIAVKGYEGNTHLPSGDDEFLLRKMKNKYPAGVKFLKNPEATVQTKPANSFNEFFNQKIRWAGKWKLHTDILTMVLAIFIFIFNVSYFSMLISAFLGFIPLVPVLIFILIKIGIEYLLAMQGINSSAKHRFLLPSMFLSIIYPIYAISIGVLSTTGSYSWKGRTY